MEMLLKSAFSLTLAAGVAGAVFAGDVGGAFALRTANTEMNFKKRDGRWLLFRYGPKLRSVDDVVPLADLGNGAPGYPDTLITHGGEAFGGDDCERYGGLAVTHADGVLSTALVAAGAKTVDDQPGVTHLVLELKDSAYPFFVTQHFRAMGASDVIETWYEVRHEEKGDVKIRRMDSLAIRLTTPVRDPRVMSLAGRWGAEAQMTENPVGRGQSVVIGSRSGVRTAWEGGDAFMLSLDGATDEGHGDVLGAALAWSGSAQGVVARDNGDSVSLNLGVDLPGGAYTLEAGRTLVLPKVALTRTTDGKGQASRNFHRWARDYRLPNGHVLRPVLLNNWEGTGMNFSEALLGKIMDGAKDLGAELFVLDDGWFSKGKYARDDDRRGLGDWFVNPEKLPNGLYGVATNANARGLKFGFWIEPEMASTLSFLYEKHPDWILREPTRRLRKGRRGGTQVVLDFSNRAVVDDIYAQLDTVMKTVPGLSYIKWDANADFMNYGSPSTPADRQANFWFDYMTGVYDLFGRLRKAHPGVMFQTCASGGARMDYGVLGFAEEFWGSDDTDPNERVYIQWGESQFFPACALASHITRSGGNRGIPIKFRCDISMSARLGVELVPFHLAANELATVRRAIGLYKTTLRPLVQQGDLYRLVSPVKNDYAALMYVSEDKSEAVVFVYGLVRRWYQDFPPALRLAGLDPARRYKVMECDVTGNDARHSGAKGATVGGDALMDCGLPITLGRHYDSAVFHLKAE